MTDRNVVDRVHVAELSLGPSIIRNLQLPALREADLGGAGMIGIDALARQRLMMDFEKRLIRVEDASRPVRSQPGDIVVTRSRSATRPSATSSSGEGSGRSRRSPRPE
jgi:hypothetical protein